ncbi:flagellar basal body-associated FliL family protein [Paracoccus aerodenitrificans]|uniref:flagellar basal body-associated FliL family protein n=1 Tax=Paracoccus aerodenitrificans TaxID=3017781 RepID=UPI0022F0C8C4|nr:flagellar basal body-associated FliL family protein [Paracoccus aerodenitrificans]WBU63954.1 flagellar basal body-associated FliL family protein [Paracoccus aerodenitrificans]
MSETLAEDGKSGRLRLVAAIAVLVAGGGAFAAGYLGLVSPSLLFSTGTKEAETKPEIAFVDVPRIVVPLAGRDRQLVLSVKLEASPANAGQIQTLLPRLSDSFNRFLSDIEPAAIDRRGVLEIIRAELLARAKMVLGPDMVENLLITEFAIE